jgi:tetratricopeptide (TPR) repeat protein
MQAAEEEKSGSLKQALVQCAKLLQSYPDLAVEQAREILKALPAHPYALLMLGAALRLTGKNEDALAILDPLAKEQPHSVDVQFELGMVCAALGDRKRAIEALSRATGINPKHVNSWKALSKIRYEAGDSSGGQAAFDRYLELVSRDPRLIQAGTALHRNDLSIAERLLKAFVKQNPEEPSALRMLGEVAARLRRYGVAQNLFAECLQIAPAFVKARLNLAQTLHRENLPRLALEQIDILQQEDLNNSNYLALRAAVMGQIGEYNAALAIYENIIRSRKAKPKIWVSYGHTLRSLGRTGEAINAYRKSIEMQPSLGEAYWSLANLKTYKLSDEDVAQMRAQLARDDLKSEDRYHLDFAIGKALEDAKEFAASFDSYAKANALRRREAPFRIADARKKMDTAREVFSPALLEKMACGGSPVPDPIFIVGLPRSGSTLIEQILSSHSQVEGTMELSDILTITRNLGDRRSKDDALAYPKVLSQLGAATLRALGEKYISETRIQRKTNKPYFIDKMPNNFQHVGFIHLILPNAKIIDARRYPLSTCFSCFKQHFARGQNYAYDLEDLGWYYAAYVEWMAHIDSVLPRRVHRVFYEQMVGDTEREVRKLLDYCGLPFEEACLRFYENERAVRTPSSEQVRRPIFRDGLDQWRNYEPWLEPLKRALGPVLETYPAVPTF